MKKTILHLATFALLLSVCSNLNAQVTVGSNKAPEAFSLLELISDGHSGLRLPQLTEAQRNAMTDGTFKASPLSKGLQIFNLDNGCMEYWNGSDWRSYCDNTTNWFYMPSIVIDVTTSGTFSRDLHLEYKKQFCDSDNSLVKMDSPLVGTPMVKSDAGAPNPFSKIYDDVDLYYYVTGYDTDVFSNISITSAGILTYTVNADNVSDATYMNIVFVVK